MLNFDDVRAIPSLTRLFADGYDVAAIYPYTSLQGDVLYWRARFEHPSKGKQIRPIRRAAGDVFDAKEPQSPSWPTLMKPMRSRLNSLRV